MKAVIYERYGPPEVLELRDLPRPDPADDEVLIRICVTTVTAADWRARSLEMPRGFGGLGRLVFGIRKPRKSILGSELAGEIVAAGSGVTRFGVGDRVVGFADFGLGCYAEYRCMKQDAAIAPIPQGLSYGEAATIPFGGTTALTFFRRANLRAGESVLVNGASGSVGCAAVQLARHLGADVTAVCSSSNEDLARSLGADRVIAYDREDFTAGDRRYDVVVDTAGTAPYARSRKILNDGGRLLVVLGTLADLLRAPFISLATSHRVIAGPASVSADDLRYLVDLAEKGAFRAVIDRRYPLEEIVDAHRYVDTGRKRGNVVIDVAEA